MKIVSGCHLCEGCSGGEDSTCNRDWEKGSKKPVGLQQVVKVKAVAGGSGEAGRKWLLETRYARSDQLEDYCRAQPNSSADGQFEPGGIFWTCR